MQLVGQKQLRVISVTNESLVTIKFITLELEITLLSLSLEAVITRLISDLCDRVARFILRERAVYNLKKSQLPRF